MTTTLVTGAPGTLGTPTVARLPATGHDVRALGRRDGPGLTTGNLLTGTGLRKAVTGADTVLHLATGPRGREDVAATRTPLRTAVDAGVRHLVLISIVGIEDIPPSYYRDKVVIERLVRKSGLPYSILRAPQFHSFVEAAFTAQRPSSIVVAPAIPCSRSRSKRSPIGWSSWPAQRRPAGCPTSVAWSSTASPTWPGCGQAPAAHAGRSCRCRCRGSCSPPTRRQTTLSPGRGLEEAAVVGLVDGSHGLDIRRPLGGQSRTDGLHEGHRWIRRAPQSQHPRRIP